MREAGFVYWPGSKLKVAKWSIAAEDYVLGLGLEIEEDDTPDDVENRAERFQGYAVNAKHNAEAAQKSVDRITDGIPFGQPILIGHHSERHARTDANRIDRGMQKVIAESERAAYWKSRAAASIDHAAHKERPDVIMRRIKKLEAERRSIQRSFDWSKKFLGLWNDESKELTAERATMIANIDNHLHCRFTLAEYPRTENTYEGLMSLWSALNDGIIGPEKARELAVKTHEHGMKKRATLP